MVALQCSLHITLTVGTLLVDLNIISVDTPDALGEPGPETIEQTFDSDRFGGCRDGRLGAGTNYQCHRSMLSPGTVVMQLQVAVRNSSVNHSFFATNLRNVLERFPSTFQSRYRWW